MTLNLRMFQCGFAKTKIWSILCVLGAKEAERTDMTASVGELSRNQSFIEPLKSQLYGSILRLTQWLDENDYRGYDTFDGLNARLLRPLTFETTVLRQVLQQGVRRFPLNLRPLL